MMTTPKTTDKRPFRIRSHSPLISLRSLIAAAMRKMPVTMDHALASIRSAKAAAAGA